MKKMLVGWLVSTAVLAFAEGADRAGPGRVSPGPDEGGMLPVSVQNEVEVAVDRGLALLAALQAKDGGFGVTNRLFYTLAVGTMLDQRKQTEPAERAANWVFEQQAQDGGFGERDRFFYTAMAGVWLDMRGKLEEAERAQKWIENFLVQGMESNMQNAGGEDGELHGLVYITPLLLVDKADVGWREKLARQRLAAQRVNGGKGYWRGRDVPELVVENGTIKVGKPGEFISTTENGVFTATPAGFVLPRAVTDAGNPLSDFEATVFVLLQLMEL